MSIEIPQYKVIDKISIQQSALKSIVKYCINCVNQKIEGVLFGRETSDEIVIGSAIPIQVGDPSISNIVNYLETNRMDSNQIGFFFYTDTQVETMSKSTISRLIAFQKKFPNAVVLTVDSEMLKTHAYPFKLWRLHKTLMDTVDMVDIQEEEGSPVDIFKKFISSKETIKELNFTIQDDVYSIYSSLVTKESEEEKEQLSLKDALYTKIMFLNKTTDKFIEEQKKYIEYYKVKKSYGKKGESEFNDLLVKKGGDLAKLDKIDISLYSDSISMLNSQIKTLTDQINVKNSFNLEI